MEKLKKFKNRTFLGICLIIAALLFAFVITPLVARGNDNKVNVLRVKIDVSRGALINEACLETVAVSADSVPRGTVTEAAVVIGKYAACDLKAGDYIFETKLSESGESAESVLANLSEEMLAISVSIESYAGGLSGKLENGDIVRILYYKNGECHSPEGLNYVRLITTTTSDGVDSDMTEKNGDGAANPPATATLLVNRFQAEELVCLENAGKIHIVLVYRGEKTVAESLLELQEEYFRKAENATEEEKAAEWEESEIWQ